VVRRRYMEPLQFVTVSSISTNIGLTANYQATASLDNSATSSSRSTGAGVSGVGDISRSASGVGTDLGVASLVVAGGQTVLDSPTVTITPRQGEDISRQLHDALPVSAVADLVSAGYPLDGAILMLVEGINDVRGPTLGYNRFHAGSDEWREALALIKRFSEEGSFIIDRFQWNDPYNDYPYPAASITPECGSRHSPPERAAEELRWRQDLLLYEPRDGTRRVAGREGQAVPDGARLMELLNIQPDVQKGEWLLQAASVVEGPDLTNTPNARRPTLKFRMRSLQKCDHSVLVPRGCTSRRRGQG